MEFNNYKYNQWIFNSDRLVLNAKKDNIFLLAAKDLTTSVQGEVHFDSKGKFVVNAPKIQLGIKEGSEPIAKGQTVVNIFNGMLSAFGDFCTSLATATGQGVGVVSLLTINTAAEKLQGALLQSQKDIEGIKSSITFSN